MGRAHASPQSSTRRNVTIRRVAVQPLEQPVRHVGPYTMGSADIYDYYTTKHKMNEPQFNPGQRFRELDPAICYARLPPHFASDLLSAFDSGSTTTLQVAEDCLDANISTAPKTLTAAREVFAVSKAGTRALLWALQSGHHNQLEFIESQRLIPGMITCLVAEGAIESVRQYILAEDRSLFADRVTSVGLTPREAWHNQAIAHVHRSKAICHLV